MSDPHRFAPSEGNARRELFIQRLCAGGEDADFSRVRDELHEIVPHRFFAYAVVRTSDARVERLYNLDAPLETLERLQLREARECGLFRQWLIRREPLILGEANATGEIADPASHTVAAQGAVAFHAQLDLASSRAIVFCFTGVTATSREQLVRDLEMLTPYLYAFAVRAIRESAEKGERRRRARLTRRQVEVLRWLCHGKTNEEIATILGISVFTVKNHVQRILLKLDVANRVEAVAKADGAGLLEEQDADTPQRA